MAARVKVSVVVDPQMVALVRLLGHEGMPLKEMRDKAKPLVEKFGRERLQEAADEIVETTGDGDDAIVRLTEQAQKLAIQLIGRLRFRRPDVSKVKAGSPTFFTSLRPGTYEMQFTTLQPTHISRSYVILPQIP